MKISVIVPAYNCEQYLRRAVESLLVTDYRPMELFIIDDGSQDRTLEIANSLCEEHRTVVRVLRHPGGVNRGVSASRNLGIECSSGELIAFLDADDYVYPWRFESAAALLESRHEIDGVHQVCELRFSDDESARSWWEGETSFGFITPVPEQELLFQLLRSRCWATSAILFRRRLLGETGLFNTKMRVCEDCHLWMRMAACGRIASGDLSRPVSVYWRRSDSAYQPSLWRRSQMITAMSSFYRWLRRRDPSDPRLPRVSKCITDYILTGIENARLNGDRRLAWWLASRSSVSFPSLFGNRRLYGNLVRMALGR